MCHGPADLPAIAARHGASPHGLGDAARLAEDALIAWDGGTLVVTPAGLPFVRAVAAAFDARYRRGA
jgi:coproporphyrinogen III oxidase-like Fe-S oxidoreductase